MKRLHLLATLLIISFCTSLNAQTLDTDALKNFPPSVAREVFEVARYVKLTGAEQAALAEAFVKEDEAFVAAVAADGGILSVKAQRKLENMRDKTLARVLDKEQLAQYYRGVFDAEALAEGNRVADKFRKEYNITDQNWKFIRIAYYKIGLESRVINKMEPNAAAAKKKIAELKKKELATIEAKGGIRINDDMTLTVVKPFDPNALHKN